MAEKLHEYIERQMKEHYGKSFSGDTLADWLMDLKGFKFIHIDRAFSEYRQGQSRFAPTSGAIRNLARKHSANDPDAPKDLKGDGLRKCFVERCNQNADERKGAEIWMCGQHSEEAILKTQPASLQAEIIRRSRQFEIDAKSDGLSNYEFFVKTNPSGERFVKNLLNACERIKSPPVNYFLGVGKGIPNDAIAQPQQDLGGN